MTNERYNRAREHIIQAARHGQPEEHKIAEALADIRTYCREEGYSFRYCQDLSWTKHIRDRVLR